MIKGYRKLRKDEKIKEYDMFFRQSEDILVPVYSEWVGTGAVEDFIYRPIKKHENKYSYPKRIDLEGFMKELGLNEAQRGFMKSLIQNNYRRRVKHSVKTEGE